MARMKQPKLFKQGQGEANAQLRVMLAVLKTNVLIETLAVLNLLLAMLVVVYLPKWPVKLCATLVIVFGMAVLYFAVRIRIDHALFEKWDTLDTVALDSVLQQINPKHSVGMTLEHRLSGTYYLFQKEIICLLMQMGFLLATLWSLTLPPN